MFIIELIRYLFGYVNFTAYGGFADRFINLCAKDSVPLWNIRNTGGRITASTTVKGYLSIRNAAKKSGMRVIHTDKKGLRFFIRRNKARVGILAGALISALLVAVLSQFVWSVSVVGNTTLENDYILSLFENYGVKVGAKISDLDLKGIAARAVNENQQFSWAAVNRKGAVVVIEVRETTKSPEMYDSSVPTNVVASEDGVVLSVDVLYGTAEIKSGSAVTKGDLLISGIISHSDGSETPVHADGHVKALVKRKKTFSPDDFSLYPMTSETKTRALFFFGIKIPLGKKVCESYSTEHKAFVESGDVLLPVGVFTRYGADYSEQKISADEKTQKVQTLYAAALYAKQLLDYSDIKTSSLIEKNGENGRGYEFYAECEQEIGTLQEIYVEKN